MNWLYYLLEANCYFCIMYGFYWLALKKETYYRLSRWYLLFISFVSFILPMFSISFRTNDSTVNVTEQVMISYDEMLPILKTHQLVLGDQVQQGGLFAPADILLIFYFIIVLLFAFRLSSKLVRLLVVYCKSKKVVEDGTTYVVIDAKGEVFSFFNWLFVDRQFVHHPAVIAHELVHIKQRHSFDVLWFEILRCFNWFNPVFSLMIKDAKLNHECIADRQVVEQLMSPFDYANLLITHAYQPSTALGHSAFEKTQLEYRIGKLAKESVKWQACFKYLMIFPLLLFLFCFAAFKIEKPYAAFKFVFDSKPSTQQATLKTRKLAKPLSMLAAAPRYTETQRSANVKAKELQGKGQLSELVDGPTTLDQIAAAHTAKGERLRARDYLLYWTINRTGDPIRKVAHSVLSGTEAQLFRGAEVDTLYVDHSFYKVEGQTVQVHTDHLMIGYAIDDQRSEKALVIVDPARRTVVARLQRVNIKTKGSIYKVVANLDYGYQKKVGDSTRSYYVDLKAENSSFKYILTSMNFYVREAEITANQVFTNETKLSKDDPPQPGIIW